MRAKVGRAVCAAMLIGACSTLEPSFEARQDAARFAAEQGLAPLEVQANGFDLAAFTRRPAGPAATLTVYIEGDGAAWPTPYHPPRDPTPSRPVALALAAADPAPAVAYLGRPCQYLAQAALERCPSAYWTEERFAPAVVEAYDHALAQLKNAYGAQRIRLVGYSGGGVVAALLAARRDDVERLITVAAPLAVVEWSKWHGVSPLTGSLDPDAGIFSLPPGIHFAGADDKVVPAALVERFAHKRGGRVEVVAGFDHECCWTREWSRLLRLDGQEVGK